MFFVDSDSEEEDDEDEILDAVSSEDKDKKISTQVCVLPLTVRVGVRNRSNMYLVRVLYMAWNFRHR